MSEQKTFPINLNDIQNKKNASIQTDFPIDSRTVHSLKEICNFFFYIIMKFAFVTPNFCLFI